LDRPATPYELLYGKKPDVSYLRVFGATAYVLVPKELRRKLDPVSQKGVMVGYATDSKAYRVLLNDGRKVVIGRDVVFDEKRGVGGRQAAAEHPGKLMSPWVDESDDEPEVGEEMEALLGNNEGAEEGAEQQQQPVLQQQPDGNEGGDAADGGGGGRYPARER
jgi:hypothetical protein